MQECRLIQKLEKGAWHAHNRDLRAEPLAGSKGSWLESRGANPHKAENFWQLCAEFPLEYWVFFFNILLFLHTASKRTVAVLGTPYD